MPSEVPPGWRTTTLGDFTTLQRGIDLPDPQRRRGDVPVLGSFGITGWHDEPRVPGPGVTVGRSGASYGVVSFSAVDFWPLNTALYVKDFHGNDPRFAYYFLLTFPFQKFNSGSAQPSLNRNFVHPTPVSVPPPDEQRRIAAVLGALDDKIELNRKMNRTLEAMAQAIFKSWFIDFDGHDPAAMVDSELGPIPRGWRIRRAEDVADIGIGKTPPRKEAEWFSTNLADVPWVSIRDMGACGVYVAETAEYLTKAAVDRHRVRRIPDNTVVVSFKLTVGRVAIADGEMCSNEAIAHFRLPEGSPLAAEFLYCCLKAFRYEDLGSTSSIATAVNSKSIQSMKLLIPDGEAVLRFQHAAMPLFRRIKVLSHQNRTLAALRDALLPKLISGEIRVPEAEAEALAEVGP